MSAKNTSYLTGKLLLAMPSIGDPRFHRAVVFICAHDDEGAMGLIINNEMPNVAFSDLARQLKVQSDMTFDHLDFPILAGGPVETGRGFLLHSMDFSRDETLNIGGKYGITGTVEALSDVAKGHGPDAMLFILGYAGWDAGQLEEEVKESAWLVVDSDPALIFEQALGDKWGSAINKLGIDPGMLSGAVGSA